MADAFYVPEGGRFVPTELTRGPWDPDAQHAGPPSALLGRALERHEAEGGRQMGRVTFEILRPIPIAPLSVSVRTLRGGRSVELLEATLSDERGDVIRANAWRLRTRALDLPGDLAREPAPPGPEEGAERDFFPTGQDVGYHTAIDLRFLSGGFLEAGPARVWMRLRVPVVEGEDPSPLQRVLAAADSGNGVSAALDYRRFVFINTDLSVHLHRMPAGEWVLLDAVTTPEPEGVGMAESALYDERGRIGRAVQTLMVAER
jgi:Thioesterase-like superfamily